jgi:hypothetical protein
LDAAKLAQSAATNLLTDMNFLSDRPSLPWGAKGGLARYGGARSYESAGLLTAQHNARQISNGLEAQDKETDRK